MDSWHSYPKIYNLGHNAVSELLFDEVVIEEKIDGSQFSFGRFGTELRMKSKGANIVEGAEGMFYEAAERVRAMADKLHGGHTYRAEYLMKPKHNVLAYDRAPAHGLIIFDVNPAEERYMSYADKQIEASRLDLECVPLLYKGKVESPEMLKGLLDRTSVLGGQKIEGFVIKNYARFGADKKVLMGKYVSEAFKEIHKGEWKAANPSQADIVTLMGEAYRTPARWNKAIQHAKEKGLLENSPRDIPVLIKEVQNDIMVECGPEMIETLMKWACPKIMRSVIRGLPEFYKQHLLDVQFESANQEGDV